MKNYRENGRTLTVPSPYDVTSGDVVVIGAILGVAATTQLSGEDVAVDIEGVFELVKVTTDNIGIGDKLYWDSGQKKLTKTPGTGSKPFAGIANRAAGNGATTVECRLTPTGITGPA